MKPTSILKLFGRSPISPLQKHMAKVHECAEKLLDFFAAVFANDWEMAEKCQGKISKLEQDADAMKSKIRSRMPTRGMFFPVDRSDLLQLVSAQDKIANKAKDIAGIILGRKMQFPETIAPKFLTFVKRSVAASAQATKAISELDELLEAGFRGKEVTIVEKMLDELDRIEMETDILQRELRKMLFEIENDMPPVEVMFLYKIIEWVGELADRSQHVGGRLQLLLAH